MIAPKTFEFVDTPALRHTMSNGSKVGMILSHAVESVTSRCTYSPPTSTAMALPRVSLTSAMTTLAPSRVKRRAISAPMPLAPPVMNARWSVSCPDIIPQILFVKTIYLPCAAVANASISLPSSASVITSGGQNAIVSVLIARAIEPNWIIRSRIATAF